MAMNLTIDIDYEFADKVTLANLKASYEMVCREITDLERIISRETWQEEDYVYAKKNRKALKRVIKYFMNHSEAKEYFNEQ